MSGIEFGIGLGSTGKLVENARKAEALAYDFVSCGEHVFFHGPVDNGLIALAAAAGATTKIKLMSTITLVPLYPPALLAKQVTTLDRISNGRFHLGVGIGGEFTKEFEACNVPVRERGARVNEALQVMTRLWTQDNVTFRGRFSTLSDVTLCPKPVQAPHPPIWIAGRSEAAMKRCAKFGTGWLPYMYTPERLAESLKKIHQFSEEGRSSQEVKGGIFLTVTIHDDARTATRMATDQLSAEYRQDFSALVDKYAITGNPETCIARLREYVDAGARTIILSSACPDHYVAENETMLARTVLPAFKRSGYGACDG